MKIPLKVLCSSCNKEKHLYIELQDTSYTFECECGNKSWGYMAANITIGHKLLERSHYELNENNDYSLSIVLSAMAFECELSNLYHRWTDINTLEQEERLISDEEIDDLLRKQNNILTKIDQTSRLMDIQGFDSFAKNNTEICDVITNGFPSLDINDLSISIRKQLFWPRNRILHSGKTKDIKREDAVKCFNISTYAIYILECMDDKKAKEA